MIQCNCVETLISVQKLSGFILIQRNVKLVELYQDFIAVFVKVCKIYKHAESQSHIRLCKLICMHLYSKC